jgi:hypothetical protein
MDLMSGQVEQVNAAVPVPAAAPLVSLCVSAHNYARFLPACLDSILNQSYRNIECIVVDDGSTDETPQVLTRYTDRVTVIRNPTPRGQLNAMFAGFQATRGQFVSFVDADDFLYRDFVMTHVTALTAPEGMAAMSGSVQHNVDAEGHVLGVHPTGIAWPQLRLPRGTYRRRKISSRVLGEIQVAVYDPQCNYMHQWLWGTTSSMMFRGSILRLIADPAPDGGNIFADAYMAHFSHAIGGTVMIELPLSAYRRHGGNMYANNTLVGGLAPLSTCWQQGQEPQGLIARQLEANLGRFRQALGLRRFVVTLEKFCSFAVMRRVIADPSMKVGRKSMALFLLMRASRHIRIAASRFALLWSIARLREFS